jgi:polyhydroxyalkanoate synthesis regulator phasin
MSMWFFDEAGDLEEYQAFRRKDQPLEKVHLELRLALQKAEAALRNDPANPELKAKVEDLKKKLKDLEEKAPWLLSDYPMEVLLFLPPHG